MIHLHINKICFSENNLEKSKSELLSICGRKSLISLGQVVLKPIELEISYKESGAPFIKDHEEYFYSISHSGRWAISSISDHPVGIDIEEIKPRKESLLEFISTNTELEIVGAQDRILIIWCIKESIAKALEVGNRINYKSIQIVRMLGKNKFLVQTKEQHTKEWYANIMRMDNYIISVSTTVDEEITLH